VAFDPLDVPFDEVDFSADAALMQCPVANLDTVSVTSGDHSDSLTACDVSTTLGNDVKGPGRHGDVVPEARGDQLGPTGAPKQPELQIGFGAVGGAGVYRIGAPQRPGQHRRTISDDLRSNGCRPIGLRG